MATESKKLQTTYTGHRAIGNLTDANIYHDLVIAHEQREVIRKQDAALRAALEPLGLYHAYGWPDRAGVRAKLKAALAAAAPYILED